MWRLSGSLGAALLVAAAIAPVTDGRTSPRERCSPRGSHTLLENRQARIYRLFSRVDYAQHVWGCSLRTGRRAYLGDRNLPAGSDGTFVAPIALSGSYVAWNLKYARHSDGVFATVTVLDLRNHRRLHEWDQGGRACVGQTEVTQLRVNGHGSAAWIAAAQHGCTITYEVYKADRRYGADRLDSATTIDPKFLQLGRGRMYWRKDGVEKSATLK